MWVCFFLMESSHPFFPHLLAHIFSYSHLYVHIFFFIFILGWIFLIILSRFFSYSALLAGHSPGVPAQHLALCRATAAHAQKGCDPKASREVPLYILLPPKEIWVCWHGECPLDVWLGFEGPTLLVPAASMGACCISGGRW